MTLASASVKLGGSTSGKSQIFPNWLSIWEELGAIIHVGGAMAELLWLGIDKPSFQGQKHLSFGDPNQADLYPAKFPGQIAPPA